MARYEILSEDQMDDAQKAVCADLVRSRGSVRGPFPVMLHNPGLAQASASLGEYARFKSQVEPRLLEFAVSVIGRFWGAHVEWVAHSRLAREAGIDAAVIDALSDGRRPDFVKEDEAAIYDFLTMLLETTRVDDATYARCFDVLGEAGMIDVMATMTHYTLVSMTLNTFRVPAPEGSKAPPFGPGRNPSAEG